MTKINLFVASVLIYAGSAIMPAASIELDASPTMQRLSNRLVEQGIYTRAELGSLLGPIEIDEGVLKLFARQAEAKPWYEYKNIFLKQDRIEAGREFMQTHQTLLNDVHEKYGVPPDIVTALLGVETFYGTRMGSRRVLRSLATLTAAYPRREKFFGNELEIFLKLLKTENLLASDVEGSYAGAVGIPQFMPSSYVSYAVDFNGNGKRDLVFELEDAAASVANYLVVHGWKRDAPISDWLKGPVSEAVKNKVSKRAKPKYTASSLRKSGIPVRGASDAKVGFGQLKETAGMQYFVGYENFYALIRYNPSSKYAMAIVELAEAIKAN